MLTDGPTLINGQTSAWCARAFKNSYISFQLFSPGEATWGVAAVTVTDDDNVSNKTSTFNGSNWQVFIHHFGLKGAKLGGRLFQGML